MGQVILEGAATTENMGYYVGAGNGTACLIAIWSPQFHEVAYATGQEMAFSCSGSDSLRGTSVSNTRLIKLWNGIPLCSSRPSHLHKPSVSSGHCPVLSPKRSAYGSPTSTSVCGTGIDMTVPFGTSGNEIFRGCCSSLHKCSGFTK